MAMTTSTLPDLLKILSREMGTLAEITEAMHELVCHDCSSRDASYVRAVQSIDRAQQTLDNLSVFLGALGEHVSEDCEVGLSAALETVRLTELKDRLALPSDQRFGIVPAASGDMELFS
jgi:CBS-domain-containing membrane protein